MSRVVKTERVSKKRTKTEAEEWQEEEGEHLRGQRSDEQKARKLMNDAGLAIEKARREIENKKEDDSDEVVYVATNNTGKVQPVDHVAKVQPAKVQPVPGKAQPAKVQPIPAKVQPAKAPGRHSVRIKKELTRFIEDNNEELSVEELSTTVWHVKLTPPVGTVFHGSQFTLYIEFEADYPITSPIVKFLTPSPAHPHVYSNGHICLNILYEEWSPALTTKNLCLSILSMLSSCPEKGRPEDDREYCSSTPASSNPKKTSFSYDDDTV